MKYTVHRNGEILGSFPIEDLKAKLSSGQLLPSDLTLCDGGTDWVSLPRAIELYENPPPVAALTPAISGPLAYETAPSASVEPGAGGDPRLPCSTEAFRTWRRRNQEISAALRPLRYSLGVASILALAIGAVLLFGFPHLHLVYLCPLGAFVILGVAALITANDEFVGIDSCLSRICDEYVGLVDPGATYKAYRMPNRSTLIVSTNRLIVLSLEANTYRIVDRTDVIEVSINTRAEDAVSESHSSTSGYTDSFGRYGGSTSTSGRTTYRYCTVVDVYTRCRDFAHLELDFGTAEGTAKEVYGALLAA